VDTSADPTKLDEMIVKAGGTWITPTIAVGEEVGLGFDPEWLRVRFKA
jgi:hypothetical protein